MNTRLHKLCRQLELEPETLPAPRPADVRRRVNRALGRTGRPSRRALRTFWGSQPNWASRWA